MNEDQEFNLDTTYFVRDTALKTECNLKQFSAVAERRNMLKCGTAGRFPLKTIQALDFYELALELIHHNEYALIDEGN